MGDVRMSWGPILLVSRTTVAATVTITLETEIPNYPVLGVWRNVNFWVVTANGDNTPDHNFAVQWIPTSGGARNIALVNTITTDTITQLLLQSEFSGQNEAIPTPTTVVITRDTGDVDVDIWGMFV